jgi:SAM-dependent methyltransferase
MLGDGHERASVMGTEVELPGRDAQAEINARLWSAGQFVKAYDNPNLLPAEALILSRYREAITGRVLDLGCGAGRILGYLVLLGADAHAIDISPQMVEHCRRRFPGTDVRVGDLADLKATVDGPFDAVLMSDNLIDVFDDAQRRRVLADLGELLAPGGLLVFSSHNLDHWDDAARARSSRLKDAALAAARRSPVGWVRTAVGFPAGLRNRRRLRSLQYREGDHAVVNDVAHNYALLHYYIGRVAQERQLAEVGLAVVEVLEADGLAVPAGAAGHSPWLYYIATPTA